MVGKEERKEEGTSVCKSYATKQIESNSEKVAKISCLMDRMNMRERRRQEQRFVIRGASQE